MDLHYYQRSISLTTSSPIFLSAALVHPLRDVVVVIPNAVKRGDNAILPLRPGGGQSVQRQVVQGTEGVLPLHAQGESARADLFCAGRPDQCEWDTCTGDASLDVEGYPLRNTSNRVSFYYLPILLLLP